MNKKAQALLDAQVQFFVDRLDPAGLEPLLKAEIDQLLLDAKKLKLEEVVSRQSVKDVARAYAVELEPSGAIPELVGELAVKLQKLPVQKTTKLGDLLPEKHFEEWLVKLLQLKDVRTQLLHETLSNPIILALSSDLIYRGIRGYLSENALTRGIPGAQSMMKFGKSMLAKATPKLDGAIEQALRGYVERSTAATLRESEASIGELLTDEQLHETAHEIWATLKTTTIDELRQNISHDDVEDLFVIGYEHWRSLRKTAWYGALIDAGIDGFFDKYGKTTLPVVLEEVGVTADAILRDGMRFAPQVLTVLRKKKLLEPILRRQLKPFFESAEAEALLADA
jgi:hypothetical protein